MKKDNNQPIETPQTIWNAKHQFPRKMALVMDNLHLDGDTAIYMDEHSCVPEKVYKPHIFDEAGKEYYRTELEATIQIRHKLYKAVRHSHRVFNNRLDDKGIANRKTLIQVLESWVHDIKKEIK